MASQPHPGNAPSPPPEQRVRNQRTQALIRRDVTWQIIVPLALAVIVILVPAVFFIGFASNASRSVWADVSLIFLILPAALAGLLVLALLAAFVYGLRWLLRELPYYFKIGQDWVALLSYRVNNGAEKVAGVFMSVRAYGAAVSRAARDVRAMFTVRRAA